MNICRKIFVLLIVILTFLSCGNKGPVVYKSISGSWRCQEFPSIGVTRSYIVEVDRRLSDTTQYLISNFYNLDNNENIEFVIAHLKGTNLTISLQQIGSSHVSGIGVVNKDFTRIEFTYDIFDGLNDIKVNAIYSR